MPDHNISPSTGKETPLSGCLVRILWGLVGNFVLAICLILLFTKRSSFTVDIIYWVTVILMLISRYIDIKKFQGITLEGKEASIHDWKKYRIFLLSISSFLWVAVHLFIKFVKL